MKTIRRILRGLFVVVVQVPIGIIVMPVLVLVFTIAGLIADIMYREHNIVRYCLKGLWEGACAGTKECVHYIKYGVN